MSSTAAPKANVPQRAARRPFDMSSTAAPKANAPQRVREGFPI